MRGQGKSKVGSRKSKVLDKESRKSKVESRKYWTRKVESRKSKVGSRKSKVLDKESRKSEVENKYSPLSPEGHSPITSHHSPVTYFSDVKASSAIGTPSWRLRRPVVITRSPALIPDRTAYS